MGRHINEKSLSLIQRFEGLRLKAYKLHGERYYTIGYGHSFDASIKSDTVWTYEQAVDALKKDVEKFEGYVEKYVTGICLTDNQFGALVSYCYNRGLGRSDGSSGLRQLIKNSETIEDYGRNIVVYWGTATAYKEGLIRRRKAEQELFLLPDDDDPSSESIKLEPESTKLSSNISTISDVQKWLNDLCGSVMEKCESCGNTILNIDGVFGNKTKAAFTIVLQLYLNEKGAGLKVDGIYGNKTYNAVRKYVCVKKGSAGEFTDLTKRILFTYGYGTSEMVNQQPTFNSRWVAELMQYQCDHNLHDDGIAGQVFFKTALMRR